VTLKRWMLMAHKNQRADGWSIHSAGGFVDTRA
jgi:hypothetical protein